MVREKNINKLSIAAMLIFSILIGSIFAMPAFAADWPMWRNTQGSTGASTETINLPLTEQWHSSAPAVEENGAVVSNGIVYMSSDAGKLYAFVVATGASVPNFPVTIGFTYGSPAVDAANLKIYVLEGSNLTAFNLDGTTAWTKVVGSIGANYNEGPVIDEGYVYIKAGGNLQKYNSSGVLSWSSATSGPNTQPSIMGDYVYSNSEGGQIRKYNKATGVEIIGSGFPITTSAGQSVPAVVDGKIFFKGDQTYAYDANTGALLWNQPSGGQGTYSDSPAVSNGVVYVYGYDDAKMYAFDENTGAAKTGFPSLALNTAGAGGRNWNSPAVAGDKVFIGAGTTQKLKVLGAAGTANAGVVLEEHLSFSTDTQGFDLCSPIISDGVVFAMLDGGGLYAYFSGGTVWTGGAIKINNDAGCTESQDVTLNLDKGSNNLVNQMIISEDPFFVGASWEPYSTTKAWTLSTGYGIKTVYVQFKDSNGQLSNVFNDQIEYSANCGGESVPEFPSLVIPVAGILGLMLLVYRRREN
jgi:outer membrane protein assembly factor BamB